MSISYFCRYFFPMKLSVAWINELLNKELSADEVADRLTSTGLEVEEREKVEAIPGGLAGVCVGLVLERQPHPNADRLSVCLVDTGEESPRQIVCGASNVAAGQKVLVALPGATLYPKDGSHLTIKASKIRGEDSAGMICAEDELGLGSSHEGIMVLDAQAQIGQAAAEFLHLKSDEILTINITPNRVDGASHLGACRDLVAKAVSEGESWAMPEFPRAFLPLSGPGRGIVPSIEDETGCGRYSGITLRGVQVRDSPTQLADRLKSLGIKPQNNVVDVSNYVMYMLGLPLHTFDADKLKGNSIQIRSALPKETLTTLDEVERELNTQDLVIADAEKAVCLAGVFGGKHSGINANSSRIFIEAAWFDPGRVRQSAKRHGLHTDASFRFERGCDAGITLTALRVAARLILELGGGEIEGDEVDILSKGLPAPRFVDVDQHYLNRVSGVEIPLNEAADILTALGFEGAMERHSSWRLKVPGYRPDVFRPADVAEEVLRIYGLDRIPVTGKMALNINTQHSGNEDHLRSQLSERLRQNGWHESISLSMHSQELALKAYPSLAEQTASLENPLSKELDTLRPGLLGSMLQNASRNVLQRNLDWRVFEFGRAYLSEGQGFREEERLGLMMSGKALAEHWNSTQKEQGIYELKAWGEDLMRQLGLSPRWSSEHPLPWPGYGWIAYMKDPQAPLLSMGLVDPALLKTMDIKTPVWFLELNRTACAAFKSASKKPFAALPRFPSIQRDLAMLAPEGLAYANMEALIRKQGGALLRNCQLFDVYQGKGIPEGYRSLAVALSFADPEKTLRDTDADAAIGRILEGLATLNCRLRDAQ